MMNPDPVYQRLREIAWRRPLTAAEQAELRAWLITHPEAQAEAEAEAALGRALAKLPDAPVPSNFTARVLQAVAREDNAARRPNARVWPVWWRTLIPRLAVVVAIAGIGIGTYRQHETTRRKELMDAWVTVAGTGPLADPTVMEDFEVIRHLSQVDEGLLALSDDLLTLTP